VYIPRLRIRREEYQKAWGYFSARSIEEKSVADFDEDPITMGVEAGSNALRNADMDASEMDAVYFASTSQPYMEKQNASTIATALGCRDETATLDIASSTRSGTSALLASLDHVGSGRGRHALIVAADCPVGDPSGPLEHQLGAAAAAMIVGNERVNASVEGSLSITSESLGERFRRDGHVFVSTADLGPYHERIAGDVVASCISELMTKLGRSASDYDWLVLQGLDETKALELSKQLGFEENKIAPSMISAKIGDVGAAASVLALSKVLEAACPKQLAILCSYGAGSGADALSVSVQGEMRPSAGVAYGDYLATREYVDYIAYLKLRRFLGSS
jgi:hydroxymethylglutaryl-CoA synthase